MRPSTFPSVRWAVFRGELRERGRGSWAANKDKNGDEALLLCLM